MAAIRFPKTLKNCNLFIQGEGYAGKVLEIELPAITMRVEEQGIGVFAPIPVCSGLAGALKASFTMVEYSGKAQNRLGKENTTLMIYGAISDDSSPSATAVTVVIRGVITEYNPSSWKPGESTKDKYAISATYVKFTGNGGAIEIDADNNRFVVEGEDLVETIRNKIST